jgi:A/G-specific adenine glycosylase
MSISQSIRNWYHQNKRDLPWRNTQDPFKIWLSEIILQQTRVDQGLSYYHKFTEKYANVSELAKAKEEEILKLWQGLGYYSRARNLHTAAKQIAEHHQGSFPKTYQEIIKLKGIGPYTAAAIASFAFKLPHAVVDGNVYRVLSRLFNEASPINSSQGIKLFQNIANELLDPKHPDQHNQAIMELGATLCTPKNPNCLECPVQGKCLSFENKTIESRPIKEKKIKVKQRYFNYFILINNNTIALEKRSEKGIWQNLYQPILIESEGQLTFQEALSLSKFSTEESTIDFKQETSTHKLSHQHIHCQSFLIQNPHKNVFKQFDTIDLKNLKDFPIPRLVERIFAAFGLL